MTEQEIYFLRSKCRSLETQTKQLELTKSRLQSQLTTVQASLSCDHHQNVGNKIPTCCQNGDRINHMYYAQKLDIASKLLKLRLQWEVNQAFQRQWEQQHLNPTDFRSDLLVWTQTQTSSQAKDSNTIITERAWSSQQHVRSSVGGEVKVISGHGHQHKRPLMMMGSVAKLKKVFARRTAKLLKELDDRNQFIAQLQNSIVANNNPSINEELFSQEPQQPQQSSELVVVGSPCHGQIEEDNGTNSLPWQFDEEVVEARKSNTSGPGPVRFKVQRNRRNVTSRPYHRLRDGRLNSNYASKFNMNDLEFCHPVENNRQQPYFSLPSNGLSSYNYHYSQCGGSMGGGLETLPEASSEEESLPTVKDDAFLGGEISSPGTFSSATSYCSSASSSLSRQKSQSVACMDFSNTATELEGVYQTGGGGPSSKIQQRRKNGEECKAADHPHKIFLLESIIQQLRDELRECRDQNELLEFRLLEIEEAPHSNNKQDDDDAVTPDEVVREDDHSQDPLTPSIGTPELPLDDDGPSRQGENHHHAVATESRSSCSSDCSESLSFQESGIFDGQGSDDGLPNGLPSPRSGRSHISRELANLTFQIEELLRRYNEGSDCHRQEKRLDTLERLNKLDVVSDLSYCRQRIQEFEKRLFQMNDITHMRSLEDKVNHLLVENKRLEEERTEIEEAENDNRYLCQRLEEKVRQLKKKKLSFHEMLSAERGNMEMLQKQILLLQNQNSSTYGKVTQLEALIQSYEQKNFDLEESCMEMRCSVQFVLYAMPAISFVYFWQYLMHWSSSRCNRSPPVVTRMCYSICAPRVKPPVPPKYKYAGVKPKIPPRKHKLQNALKELEPIESKKLKSVVNQMETPTSSGDQYQQIVPKTSIQALTTTTTLAEEWARRETLLCEKIDALQQDLDRIGEKFLQERTSLMEMYEIKLGEKEKELKQSQQCHEEKRELEEKWNSLTNELEQFAAYFGRNIVSGFGNLDELQPPLQHFPTAAASTSVVVVNGVEDIMDNINANNVDMEGEQYGIQKPSTTMTNDASNCSNANVMVKLIPVLQSTLKDHLTRFEEREHQLQAEIDRLVVEMRVKACAEEEAENNMVTHLGEENDRLQCLLKDQEQVWIDLKQAQDENERLRAELSEKEGIRKRVEEMQRTESELRERLEDAERTESNLQSQLGLLKRKEQKGEEKVQQLIHELQFLRSKCCQLQDELDSKGVSETKYKGEIQLLSAKLRESTTELEEKEMELESNENSLQAKIAQLKTQLQELYQTYADTECSNGMLREEVSYLEKTVEEALAKSEKGEGTIAALSHELKQKDSLIEELETQIRSLRLNQPPSIPGSPHELSDFNNCEGGLNGVVRAVQEAVGLIQRCRQCEGVGAKLMEIADTQLIPLIQILQSSPVTDFRCSIEPEFGMKRCESDEILINPTNLPRMVVENSESALESGPCGNVNDEDEILIARLQKTMSRLTLQITKLEEHLNIRQAEMKESHMTEIRLWKHRCIEKNVLIQLLGRRIAHLSATDVEGHFINGILTELRKLEQEFTKNSFTPEPNTLANSSSGMMEPPPRRKKLPIKDFSFNCLRSFLASERQRVLELLESVSLGTIEESAAAAAAGDNRASNDTDTAEVGFSFHVVRKIGDDALLVSWTVPEGSSGGGGGGVPSSSGYEIAVNGSTYLKIPKANRHKAVLFGLNFDEPLRLTFRCPGDPSREESTITFIS